ncbi:InlB B-repeat-containing protein [Ruminococcus sp.]|uniref:InlB B-repeat-containing protein n=1 Tax=Ruminococcus sp. TaxID=41978 RepID=UPI002E7853B2|nr:InlB B-repeat-containing protein [Ruminococcus sp.]MEE0740260.1 InlB B-repeat-containing protein [Ruminococcus sp.]
MKTNFKRIGKQSISIVLAVMMMLSTMLVGMVTSNAAINNWVLSGSFNNWTEIPFGGADGGSITYDLSAYKGTTVEFRTDAYENNKLNKNSTGNIVVAGTEYQLTWGKPEPMKYTVSSTGTGKVTFTVNSKQKNNYLTVTEGDQPITVTPYYVAGEDRLVNGSAWTPEQAENKMSYDETTEKYSITYDKKAAGTYKFKIIEGSSTWHGYNDFKSVTCTDENCTVSDVDGEYHNIQITTKEESNITITLDSTDSTGKKLIISAEPTTQKYTVAVDKNITNGTVTPSATSLAAGKTFTVTATPNDGYELDTITVTDAEGKSVAATNESTHTYTMPASNVTVSATFAQKPDCRLGFGYATGSSDTMGTFSCSSNGTSIVEGTYPYGTEVTFNAVAKEGYVFKGWYSDINGTSDCLSTNTTYTFKLTKETDVFAKFAEATGTVIPNLYLIYSDSTSDPSKFTQYLNLYRDADGQVYAYFDSEHFDSSKTYCFTISDSVGKSTSWEYAYDNYNNSKAVANEANTKYFDCGDSRWGLPKHDESSYVNTAFARFRVLEDYADTISSVKVNLGYYKGTDIVESSTDSTKATTYEIIPDATGTVSSRVKVYAKDGTVRTAYQKYADMADTVISYTGDDVTKKKSADYYEEGYAKLGSTITVTTTIDKDYRSKYYVKAFCVNGYSYGIIDSSKANADGVYSFEYTIPEDCTDKFIEITPIYYYIDDTDTVTFYVEGFDETVQKKWGNTVAVQAWYTNGVDEQKYVDGVLEGEYNSPNKNALGGYPGQPLVYEGGKYSMQIPKYLNGNKDNFVKGITLNNYIWDSIHSGNFKDQINDNCQTYDYDDFYKLSETNDVDNIIFDFRYRTTTDNKPSQAGLSSSTYNKNELEPLKDYYGNIVDIFGNILSKDWTATYDSNYLTVISNGYKEIKNIGKYATEWSVYDKDGTYITTINCSSLIDETKVDSTYQAAYKKLKSHAGLPVKIAYEKSIFQGPDNGTRADGRWYFSKKAQKISANVKIEYKADGTSPFVEDAFVEGSNVGVNTKAQAYFTNADSNGKTTCQGIVDGGNFSVHAQTDVDANYYFIGWYLKTSDGYSFITNESDADFPMTNNATYIARFIPTPSGTLTLSHTLLTGSADGKTFIKADIVDSKGNVKASIAETSGNLVVPARYVVYTSEYSIKATLRTVPYGNDTVEDFYNSNEEHYNSGVTGTGEKTYEVSKTIKELFESYEDVDHNTSYRLIKSNIPFYSNIKSNPLEYTITYTYETRLDGKQSYVIKDKVSGIELEEMWAENVAAGLPKEQLSKAFITKKAPFVSNFRNEIKWDIDHAVINGYIATVDATTKSPDLTITALAVDGGWTKPETVKYGELAVSNGDYLYKTGTTDFPAQYDYNGATKYDFSFWAIFDNLDAAQNYSNAVKAYMLDAPAADMSQRLTALTKLDGYKNLISKSYSKEYNYISYQDYYIVPVYAGRFAKNDIKESQASIRLLEYTRNQWTNANGVKGDGSLNVDGSKTDYLYTDFALSFDKDQLLIKNNPNIKVGIAFEVVARYDDVKPLDSYVTDSNTDAIRNLVKTATDSGNANGKVDTYTINNESRSVYRYEIKNSNISVKNRIEYYLRFKNSETSQQNVMKVYSYIYDKDSGEIYLSDPEYMNMYDIGNLTYITSGLANINLGPDATV